MDDLLNDIFGNDEEKKTDAQEPIFEGADAPVIKEDAPDEAPKAEPVPEVTPETVPEPEPIPAVTPETAPEPEPIPEPKPPVAQQSVNTGFGVNQPPYQPPAGAYNPPVSDRQVFYQPPVQAPPSMNNNFDVPPAFNQNRPQNPYNPPVAPQMQYKPVKKSGHTAKIIIAILAIVAVAVAFTGMVYAVNHKSDGSGSSIENFIEEKSEEKEKSSDAEAEVKSSSEAAKKKSNGELTVAGVVEKTKDSCVGITVYAKQSDFGYFYNFGSDNQSSDGEVKSGEGSGVIMSEAGGKTHIMTCAHVIEGGTKYKVTLDNDKEYDAKYVGSDAQTDIGVLSIDATGLQVAEFGDSKDISIGEDCIVIGCPGGLEFKNSVTKGIVSALDVPIASTIGYNNECIQVDAAINPGNSGGALFNMQGQVIGINSSKIASTEYEGMGFAVPSNTAVSTANSLIKNGYVKGRAKLGITYATLSMLQMGSSEILEALAEEGFKDAQGTMIISEVSDESDLKGKVEKNDMIVAVNGETMTSVDILTSLLAKSKPGDTVKLTIARIEGNRIKTFEVSCKLIEAKE